MEKEYNDLDKFMEDIDKFSLKETLMEMGILEKKQFKGQFIRCIFHGNGNERTPSLQITDNFFKCYACCKKGNIITFLMEYYNCTFLEALDKLAGHYNVSIKKFTNKKRDKLNKIEEEWNQFLENMENAPREIQVLQRDYFPETIGYDKSINYLVLPYTTKTGKVVGFTKRRINEESVPKWKHSSIDEAENAQMVHNVYNLANASLEIKKKKEIIIAEGPKDVIGYRRAGIQNVVCSSGTGNIGHVWDVFEVLDMEKIILSTDGDEAGRHAAVGTIDTFSKITDLDKVFCTDLPDGTDPYDVDYLISYYNNPLNIIDYMLKYGTDEDIRLAYKNANDFNKSSILLKLCSDRMYKQSEALDWLSLSKTTPKREEILSEKEKLIKIAKGEVENSTIQDIQKAERILKLKYKYVLE